MKSDDDQQRSSEPLLIPKKIHRVWLGGPMPDDYVAFGQKWQDLHPDWEVRTWGEADLDWLQNRAAFDDATLLSSKSNIARYEIVEREGGLYVDCDFEPLRPVEALLTGADLVLSEETPGFYCNALFAATSGHPVLRRAIDELPTSHYEQPDVPSPLRTGPAFWTRCVQRDAPFARHRVRVLTRDHVYPYSHQQMHLRDESFAEAWAVHHWAASWVTPTGPPGFAERLRSRLELPASRIKSKAVGALRRFDALQPAGRLRPAAPTYLGSNRLLVQTQQGFPVLTFADDLCVTPALARYGCHDRAFANFLDREIHRGQVVVDVGANIGLVTLHCARLVGAYGRVFAFEPNPETHQLLLDSLYTNRMEGLAAEVQVHCAAVGNSIAPVALNIPTRHRGRASIDARNAQDPDVSVVIAPMVRLDDVFAGVAEINLVKIDVEGAELGVLQGMRSLIDRGKVRMLDLELNAKLAQDDWDPLAALLRDLASRAVSTFAIAGDGSRLPMSVGRALHQEPLPHWVVEF